MTKKFEIYKCEKCGNIVEIIGEGIGELVCCGENMQLMNEKTEEEGLEEKHKPIIKFENCKATVRVGEIAHPMTKEHHLYFIEAISNDGKYLKRKYLEIDDKPELLFYCDTNKMKARTLCNLHGFWVNTNS